MFLKATLALIGACALMVHFSPRQQAIREGKNHTTQTRNPSSDGDLNADPHKVVTKWKGYVGIIKKKLNELDDDGRGGDTKIGKSTSEKPVEDGLTMSHLQTSHLDTASLQLRRPR